MSFGTAGISQQDFDQIFINWYEPVRNYIYYKCGDIQLSEDIAQDTFMKIWEKRENIVMLTVQNLAFKIAGNLFLNKMNHQKVSFGFIADYQGKNNSEAADFEMEMKEFDQKLQKALADLDEKKRTVFLMNRIDELTYTQIAGILGISVKAVEKRMSKTLEILRHKIEMNI
jgi:RNA polymerase sigma factor (sigma-70 family)